MKSIPIDDDDEQVPIEVNESHGVVLDAIGDLQGLPIGALNDTEREHAQRVLQRLYDLDDALAVRSSLETADRPSEFTGADPDPEATDDERGWD